MKRDNKIITAKLRLKTFGLNFISFIPRIYSPIITCESETLTKGRKTMLQKFFHAITSECGRRKTSHIVIVEKLFPFFLSTRHSTINVENFFTSFDHNRFIIYTLTHFRTLALFSCLCAFSQCDAKK